MLSFRDPLFSVLLLVFVAGFALVLGYFWNYFLERKKHKNLARFEANFESFKDPQAQAFLALSQNKNPQNLIFLAQIYQKISDYEKAISLYSVALESTQSEIEKCKILQELGLLYYRAGFLARAKNIFLEILKNFPREIESLKALMRVCEDLGDYKEALDALNCIEEIAGNTSFERSYLLFKIQSNNHNYSLKEEKNEKIMKILAQEPRLLRPILQYFLSFDLEYFWKITSTLKQNEILEILDLIWGAEILPLRNFKLPLCHSELPLCHSERSEESNSIESNSIESNLIESTLPQNTLLCEILALKAKAQNTLNLNTDSIKIETNFPTFELNLLNAAQKSEIKADLSFSYTCSFCQAHTPLSSDRCPHCGKLLSLKAHANLQEKKDEIRYSFL